MTQSNPFFDILTKTTSGPDLRKPVLDVLDEFCRGVAQYWQGRIECVRVPGYPTNYGQEYRIVIRSNGTGYEHTLLRAYVPVSGRPIKIDTYDYELVEYADANALKTGLELLLAKPETQDAINAYARR